MKTKFLKILRTIVPLMLLMAVVVISCNDDDDGNNVVDFGTAPDPSAITSADVEIITENTVRYHVFNFNGGAFTITMVETATTITLIDLGSPIDEGDALRAYVDALEKSISIMITHNHPDHIGNISNFTNVPVYAHAAAAASLSVNTAFTDIYTSPVNTVSNSITIGGLEFRFDNISNAETEENGYIYIPEVRALFPGDLVYNNRHNYIREYTPLDDVDELDNWINGITQLQNDFGDYNYIFVGHNGTRADVAKVIDENLEYLSIAQGLIKGTRELTVGGVATSSTEVVEELQALYPSYPPGASVFALPGAFFPGDPGANWFE